MTVKQFLRAQSTRGRYNGVQLIAQIPKESLPSRDAVMEAVEAFLTKVRAMLMDDSQPASRRRQPYTLATDGTIDQATGCRFRVEIKDDATTLNLTQYVTMAGEFREAVWALFPSR